MAISEREAKIQNIMATMKVSRPQAIQIIQEDEAINRGARLDWEPTADEEKEIRKAAKVSGERKQRSSGGKRERPADVVKREIIEKVRVVLAEAYGAENITVSNIEKTIDFSIGDEKFSFDLKRRRQSKGE